MNKEIKQEKETLSDKIVTLEGQFAINKVHVRGFINDENKIIEDLKRQLIKDFKTHLTIKSIKRFIRARFNMANEERKKLAGEELIHEKTYNEVAHDVLEEELIKGEEDER